jgi:hypothetical protein
MPEVEILMDDSHSDWLRAALRAALECDPVTAANDAEFLACLLQQRAVRLGLARDGEALFHAAELA